MKTGVIQATSQAEKNKLLYQCTVDAVVHNHRQDEVINFGVFGSEEETYSYIEIAVVVSLLLSSGAVDFVVTGCSSGQGMMLACNSLPSVLCGFVQNPQDAFLFGRINGGNAVSLPLGLNFGWLGEINLQCTLDKLFEGEFGCGYPPAEAARKKQDTEALKRLNRITKQPMEKVFAQFDRALLRKALGLNQVRQYILENGIYEPVVVACEGVEK
ncbi:MAG: RpiB/LacA/LacB family sugar-phosphate isomerase [Lachnospiraceae bacterium]|nr:RpiB/LacA/LacB family sugar-phosphate isomerase [Lachnospiraceae bacterium]